MFGITSVFAHILKTGGFFMWKKYKPYVVSIAISLGVGALSAFFTKGNMDIYEKINTPPLSPPGWLFPVVWGVLFILMGISSARIYVKGKEENTDVSDSLRVYGWQLAVNFVWSLLFFNMQAFLLSFIWLVFLWVLIYDMIKKFSSVDLPAAKLQIPYLLWVTFAGYLNFMIWLLNR